MNKTILVIAGPTASGKSDLAFELAKHFQSEIISADSRQLYREMNIGTAKPGKSMLEAIPHHFINSHSIHQHITAGNYAIECQKLMNKLFNQHRILIMCGGSGLFIDAALYGLDELPPANEVIRTELDQILKEKGIVALQEELMQKDPLYYSTCDQNNPRRLIRAIEIIRQAGVPYSDLIQKNRKKQMSHKIIYVALDLDRDELYKRIDNRVERMMAEGLEDEARSLFKFSALPALQSVGYKELFEYFRSEIALDEAVELIKKNSRNYAKRQLTWFRKNPDIHWLRPDESDKIFSHPGLQD